MRWICPQCSRSLSFGVEVCPYCADAPPPPPPKKPAGPRKIKLGREMEPEDVRRMVNFAIGAALLLATLYFVWLWAGVEMTR